MLQTHCEAVAPGYLLRGHPLRGIMMCINRGELSQLELFCTRCCLINGRGLVNLSVFLWDVLRVFDPVKLLVALALWLLRRVKEVHLYRGF